MAQQIKAEISLYPLGDPRSTRTVIVGREGEDLMAKVATWLQKQVDELTERESQRAKARSARPNTNAKGYQTGLDRRPTTPRNFSGD